MAYRVDLNSDLGESFGRYKLGNDEQVLKYITSANVACGFHAGDSNVMDETVLFAKKNNTAVGAHPGYPDLVGFGRRKLYYLDKRSLQNDIYYQIGALEAFLHLHEMKLQHVKPHGEMGHLFEESEDLAQLLVDTIYHYNKDLIVVGFSGLKVVNAARKKGMKVAQEVFADRAYQKNGKLVSRGTQGAMIEDTKVAINRILRMVFENKVISIEGEDIDIYPDTICVHGDGPHAVEFAKELKGELEKNKVQVVSMKYLFE